MWMPSQRVQALTKPIKLATRPIRAAIKRRQIRRAELLFPGSLTFWQQRYAGGDNSGGGSYGELANFKARVLNEFVSDHFINSVIEFGCGDGNQLELAKYPSYVGLDVAPTAISLCQARFDGDAAKNFATYAPESFDGSLKAELSLSLDVIYHLVEDDIFDTYMRHLFSSAERYVIIYSSNDAVPDPAAHVRNRRFTPWIEARSSEWRLIQKIDNPYRGSGGSLADFYIYEKAAG
jgi:SAM-dependent methyltransferase